MRHSLACGTFVCMLLALATPVFAGMATLDFQNGAGLLTHHVAGAGALTTTSGRAYFTGPNTTLLEQGGSVVSSGGTVTIGMTLQPSADAVNGVGLVMYGNNGESIMAVADSNGDVMLTDWIGNYVTLTFPYPAALNNSFSLTYNAATERATLTLNGSDSTFIEAALNGATSVQVGVTCGGTGGCSQFVASGSGIPNYPVDSDGDGVLDPDEIAVGTDPNDPGNLPVYNTNTTTIHPRTPAGASVVIQAGSLPAPMVKVAISAPATIPAGIVPGANKLSRAAIEMKPDGTVFSSPVTVTWPYTPLQVDGLIESGLSVYYYQGPDYSSSGISGVSINTSTHVATFTTNHFTTFVLAGPAVDSDGDGIADWWEILWFGNLTTANATSNFDGDAYTDLQEFRLRDLGFNPLVPDSVTLPAGGITALALLGIGLLGVGTRKLRSPR